MPRSLSWFPSYQFTHVCEGKRCVHMQASSHQAPDSLTAHFMITQPPCSTWRAIIYLSFSKSHSGRVYPWIYLCAIQYCWPLSKEPFPTQRSQGSTIRTAAVHDRNLIRIRQSFWKSISKQMAFAIKDNFWLTAHESGGGKTPLGTCALLQRDFRFLSSRVFPC